MKKLLFPVCLALLTLHLSCSNTSTLPRDPVGGDSLLYPKDNFKNDSGFSYAVGGNQDFYPLYLYASENRVSKQLYSRNVGPGGVCGPFIPPVHPGPGLPLGPPIQPYLPCDIGLVCVIPAIPAGLTQGRCQVGTGLNPFDPDPTNDGHCGCNQNVCSHCDRGLICGNNGDGTGSCCHRGPGCQTCADSGMHHCNL